MPRRRYALTIALLPGLLMFALVLVARSTPFVAIGPRAVQEIAASQAVEPVAQIGSEALHIAGEGDTLFMALGTRVTRWRLRDGSLRMEADGAIADEPVHALAGHDGRAFALDGTSSGGEVIVSYVEDAEGELRVASTLPAPSGARDLSASGAGLFLHDGRSLYRYRVTPDGALGPDGETIKEGNGITALEAEGSRVYLGSPNEGVQVLDGEADGAPRPLGRWTMPASEIPRWGHSAVTDLDAVGAQLALIRDSTGTPIPSATPIPPWSPTPFPPGFRTPTPTRTPTHIPSLRILDVADPVAPRVVSELRDGQPRNLRVLLDPIAGQALIRGLGDLRAVSFATPGAPAVFGHRSASTSGGLLRLGRVGAMLEPGQLRLLDLDDPELSELPALDLQPWRVAGIEPAGGALLLVADTAWGVRAVDLDGDEIRELGRVPVSGLQGLTATADGRAVILTRDELLLLDFGDPLRPIEIGRRSLPAPLAVSGYKHQRSALLGDRLYVPTREALLVLDASDARLPELGRLPGLGHQVLVDRGIAFMTADGGRLLLLSLRTPSAPSEIGSVTGTSYTARMLTRDGFCFILSAGHVLVLDARDPAHRRWEATVELDDRGAVSDGRLRGEELLVGASALHRLDISDPARPRAIGTLMPPRVRARWGTRDMAVAFANDALFVGDVQGTGLTALQGLPTLPSATPTAVVTASATPSATASASATASPRVTPSGTPGTVETPSATPIDVAGTRAFLPSCLR